MKRSDAEKKSLIDLVSWVIKNKGKKIITRRLNGGDDISTILGSFSCSDGRVDQLNVRVADKNGQYTRNILLGVGQQFDYEIETDWLDEIEDFLKETP